MSRRRLSKKRIPNTDIFYNNIIIQMLINRIMKKGNKTLARRIIYKSLKIIENNTKQDPIKITEQAIYNLTPFVEVKSRRLGGSTTQIPVFINTHRGITLAIKWLFYSCKIKVGNNYSIITRLSSEFINASNGIGDAIKKRDEIHRMAEANKTVIKYNVL